MMRIRLALKAALAVCVVGLLAGQSTTAVASSTPTGDSSLYATSDTVSPTPASLCSEGSRTEIAPFTEASTRLGGADRYAVSIGVSQRYAPGVPVVYVAKGSDFPDALSAAAAAALRGGPLLLTPTETLRPELRDELTRLRPCEIVVVGGEGSISPQVFGALADYAPSVLRVGGADRYEASRNITTSAFTQANAAFIATGRTFADALAASGAAGQLNAPVVLVDGLHENVPADTMAVFDDLGITSVYIAGGPASVSPSIESQMRNSGLSVTRLGGADRYEVAANINAAFFGADVTTGFFATGLNFPDALSGAALAGRLDSPLFVTAPSCIPVKVRDTADSLGLTYRVYLGGAASVSEAAAAHTGCLSSGAPWISGTTQVGQSLSAVPGDGWTPGTSFTYSWYADYQYTGGGPSLALTAAHAGKVISLAVTGSRPGYTTVSVPTGATARVAYPARTVPDDDWTCPAWAPIKGNASSGIYHVPGGQFYDRTNPEVCFRSERDAVDAGYRKSQR